jgi:hypothetical protein
VLDRPFASEHADATEAMLPTEVDDNQEKAKDETL